MSALTRRVAGTRHYASVALAAALWGTWSLFFRPSGLDPRWSTVIVFASMTLFGAPLLLRRAARGTLEHTRRDWAWMFVLGVGDAANAGLFFIAMSRTSISLAVLSHYLAPALVSLIAPTLLATPRVRGALTRALIATAGLALVQEPWRSSHLAHGAWIGAAFGAASAVFYAINVCASKRLARSFTAEQQLVFHSAIALAVFLPFAPWAAPPALRGAGIMVAGGAIVGVSAAMLFVRGVSRVPAEHAAVLTFLEPLTAVAVGVIAFGERLGLLAWAGAAVVIATGIAAAIQR